MTNLPTSTLNKTLATTLALLVFGLSYQAHRLARQHHEFASLDQTFARTQRQIANLANQQTHADEALAAARHAATALSHAEDSAAKPSELQSWLDRFTRLKEWLRQHPEKSIPELRFLNSNDWLMVSLDASLDSDAKIRTALSKLRAAAKKKPEITRNISGALQAYAKAHDGQSITSALDLRPYLHPSLDDDILSRYEFVPATPSDTGKSSSPNAIPNTGSGRVVLKEIPVDEDYDSQIVFMETAVKLGSVSKLGDAVKQAKLAFTKANQGQAPTNVDQLRPFLATPVNETALREYWDARK